MGPPPKIFIILVNWNGKKDTLECLASLARVKSPPFQTVVVDNGSWDGSVETIRNDYPKVPIIETKANLGFAGGNNVGIEWALSKGAEWLFLLNNDTTVDPEILQAFLDAALLQPKGKIFGAKIYRYDQPQIIDHLGGFWNPKIAEFESPAQGKSDDGSYEEMISADYVCGAALFMHQSVIRTVGLLEPRFFLFWEETDLCMRAKNAGIEVWTVPKAKVWHKISASFTGGKPHTHYFWWRSRLLWIQRNCSEKEKKRIYRKLIIPELAKNMRHYLLRSLQNRLRPNQKAKEKALRCKAALAGAWHYFQGHFGNGPKWLF